MKTGTVLVLLIATAGLLFINASWTNASGVPAFHENFEMVSFGGRENYASVKLKSSETQVVGGFLISSGTFELK